ncbi:type IV pilus secretin PilQ [Thermodesulfobacteriota bacterium]
MRYKIKKITGMKVLAIFLVIFTAICVGCVPQKSVKKTDQEDVQKSAEAKLIEAIRSDEDAESVMVTIQGNQLLTYTSVKQPIPLGVLLYFPETAPDNIDTTYSPDSSVVDSISVSELTEKGQTTRVEILLKNDVSYEVTREGNDLFITFKKPVETTPAAEPMAQEEEPSETGAAMAAAPAPEDMMEATRLESVETNQLENGVKVNVKADGAIKDFKSFTTENPARIVFDIYNVKSPFNTEQVIPVDSKWVRRVRHFGYPDRIRLVLDTYKSYLYAFSALPQKDGLLINVGSDTAVAVAAGEEKMPEYDTSQPAWVNRIDFSSEDEGKSTIVIGTTRPVKYDIKKTSPERLQLKLFSTNLPDYRRRPLITTRFETAVDRISPLQTTAMKDTTLIAIEMRESVPYYIEQIDNLLLVHFEASSVSPRPVEAADLPEWQKIAMQGTAAVEAPGAQDTGMAPAVQEEAIQEAPGAEMPMPVMETQYTGEKIAIDFYDTDIKNVFRILREISGKNFAIDKDVTGKVTLSLAKPVPWDQVLDLVLRMNALGKVEEGNIIRIATRQTLSSEEQLARAKVASVKKVEQEEKALEPLVTEYISVNYADASADILPHIVLTEGRGSATVDGRNNQIIITDVAEMIERAKMTISRIDQVTPQVIIEARIIEARKNFTRSLGVDWTIGGTVLDSTTGNLGGALDYIFQGNNPSAGDSGIMDLTFSRILGNPIDISLRINAAETRGDVEIISAPKVVTLDNTQATIKQGLAYPYNKLDADGNTTTEFKDIALELLVTPHVTPDNRISMKIDVKNNEIGDVINNELSFTTKEATTELLVNDGDTVVIGGIRKTTTSDNSGGIPGLMDIPVIGWLFKNNVVEDRKEELLIFITPRIVQLEQRTM